VFMNSLPLVTEINFNEIFNKFINLFQDILNKHASMKTRSRKQTKNSTTSCRLQRNYYNKSKKAKNVQNAFF